MDHAQKAVGYFFWIAFAFFLAASIPHGAYFFRAFEPQNPFEDQWWWTISYGIACSIDVTIFLLSMTVANLRRQRKSRGLIISVWFFILALTVLSWYINDEYAVHFRNTAMLSATGITIPVLNVEVPDINPLIASSFQAMAIAYAWISDKIAEGRAEKTAAELEAEAAELEAKAKARQRIATSKKLQRQSSVDHGLASVSGFASSALKYSGTILSGRNKEMTEKTARFLKLHPEATDEELAVYLGMSKPGKARYWRLQAQVFEEQRKQESQQAVPQSAHTDAAHAALLAEEEAERGAPHHGNGAGIPSGSGHAAPRKRHRHTGQQRGMTLAEVRAELECGDRNVRNLRQKGILIPVDGNSALITAESVEAYKRKRKSFTFVSSTSDQEDQECDDAVKEA